MGRKAGEDIGRAMLEAVCGLLTVTGATQEEIVKVMEDLGEVSQYIDSSILPEEKPVTVEDITNLIAQYLSGENNGKITIEDITQLIDKYLQQQQ